jgi:hypothetical protein
MDASITIMSGIGGPTLALKPSEGRCSASTIGFIGHIGNDVAKGLSAFQPHGIWPRLPRRVRLSHLPLGGQVRADLSRAKSAKVKGRASAAMPHRVSKWRIAP